MFKTLLFRKVVRKFLGITYIHQTYSVLVQYNIFTNINSSSWNLFSDLFSIIAKEVINIRNFNNSCSLYCSSPCFRIRLCSRYEPLQCFSTYYWKSKEIRILRPKLQVVWFLVTVLKKDFSCFVNTLCALRWLIYVKSKILRGFF